MSLEQFHAPTVITKKREGNALSESEIAGFIDGFTAGSVSEAQMASLAMAICLQGMNAEETVALTQVMLESGQRCDWGPDDTRPRIVDKHSTGGIGDKVSLILAPLLACDGNWVPMISGRGLGITGGTLDKLESIPGFRTDLSLEEINRLVRKIGCVITGQTKQLCPADKKLYALRDVTGTVPSRPLIVASIMSKKLAESPDFLVLDVKYGSGAFMKNREEAEQLAQSLSEVGRNCGVQTSAILNHMDEPLGHSVGNALEVQEAIDALGGNCASDLEDVVISLADQISCSSKEELTGLLRSGKCLQKFREMVSAQGGDTSALGSLTEIHRAPFVAEIKAEQDGLIVKMDAGSIGKRALLLGAGRTQAGDPVDFAVGFDRISKVGQEVKVGDTLIRIHARTLNSLKDAAEDIRDACSVEGKT